MHSEVFMTGQSTSVDHARRSVLNHTSLCSLVSLKHLHARNDVLNTVQYAGGPYRWLMKRLEDVFAEEAMQTVASTVRSLKN